VHGKEEDGERNELVWAEERKRGGGAERLTVRLGGIAEWRGEETSL
jgi:hypothetical protein